MLEKEQGKGEGAGGESKSQLRQEKRQWNARAKKAARGKGILGVA